MEHRVKISLMSFDLSGTCIIRAHLLARMLVQDYDVEVVGPASDGTVWEPLRDDTVVPFRILTGQTPAEQAAGIDGDLLYPLKPRPTSLGVAMAAQRQRRRPMVLDVDDWESGFLYDDVSAMVRSGFRDGTKWVARNLLDVRSVNNCYRTAFVSRHVRRADAVTATSAWLANRYGGTVIPQARDTDHFNPANVNGDQMRAELGIRPDQVMLLFMGNPRRHKGLGNVLQAMDLLARSDLLLLVVGGDHELPDRPDVRSIGWQPYAATNGYLAAADMVVLAHSDSPGARGQMPTKLYDAMSMGCPVVVTDVSDMGSAVGNAGIVVPPADTRSLAATIGKLADDPALRRRIGAAGRRRCIDHFSDQAIRPSLLSVIDGALHRFDSDSRWQSAS